MSKNKNLHKAKKEKNDEFYTLLSDIEKEMVWYKDFFKDKVVYCNCDDARESNFFKYFSENFELLGLKKLITTGYIPGGHGVVLEYSGDKNGDFMVGDDEISTHELAGDGDFRSPECIEFLKQADVVVTNPPFSLFREYIAQLMTYGKKFLIIGNMNDVNYLLPLIKENKLWIGGGGIKEMAFRVPDYYEEKSVRFWIDDNGTHWRSMGNTCWFTNIDHKRRHDKLDLCKKYNATDYPKYDNYDAINVDKVSDIPEDYFGVMGVPVSFFDKYCPSQFEIVGVTYSKDRNPDVEKVRTDPKHRHNPIIGGVAKYPRILIKRKS